RCKEMDGVRTGAEERMKILGAEAAKTEEKVNGVEKELRVEREWRTSLQEASMSNAEQISKLRQEIRLLRLVSEKYMELQEEHYALKEICTEQKRTLEELGGQLSAAKLAAVELREAADNAQHQHDLHQHQQQGTTTWANDRLVTHCKSCNREFNITRRKHHCRHCGKIFCNGCSDNSMPLPNSTKPVRVCDECYVFLAGRY
ncbi:RUN and FYVE domain-containing protein 2, partial [Habropoda laboriosa]